MSLKGRALRYLSQREHSRAELQRKLLRHLANEHRQAQAARVRASKRLEETDVGSGAEEPYAGVPEADILGADAPNADARHRAVPPAESKHDQAAAEELVRRTLDELAAAGWLSDSRAAESLVSTKASRFGVSRLRQMLAERGVDRDAADAALEQARATELQRAAEVWRRRFGEPAPDASGRARQQRFLLSRGFSSAVVRRVVGGEFEFDDGDPGED